MAADVSHGSGRREITPVVVSALWEGGEDCGVQIKNALSGFDWFYQEKNQSK